MKMVGIKKRVDNLGRICIPKSMRELYGLCDEVELVLTREGVLIRSFNSFEKKQKEKQAKEQKA